jgi:two-component system, sensor histidine kinase and response regulator
MDHASALLDSSVLQALHEYRVPDEPDPAREVAQVFLSVTPERLARLRQAAHDGDADEVRRIAHQVRGSCATVGALAMSEAAGALEGAGSDAAMLPLVLRLEDLFARTRPMLDALEP